VHGWGVHGRHEAGTVDRMKQRGISVRILLVSAVLLGLASCAWPPPADTTAAAPGPTPLFAPAPVAAAPMPSPAPMPSQVAYAPPAPPPTQGTDWGIPIPFGRPLGLLPQLPARFTLSNYTFVNARVQAILTPYTDCVVRADTPVAEFVLPLNGTRVINGAGGSSVCWRRAIPEGSAAGVEGDAGWTKWDRAILSSGQVVDSTL